MFSHYSSEEFKDKALIVMALNVSRSSFLRVNQKQGQDSDSKEQMWSRNLSTRSPVERAAQ
jgi:hypothetical protein